MTPGDPLREAVRAANERRLVELRAVDPRLAESAEAALRAVEARGDREAAELGRRTPAVRVNAGFTAEEPTASAIEAYLREQPVVDLVVRRYPAGAPRRGAATGPEGAV